MKKVLSIVLALALVFGFASMAVAMGPTAADGSSVGFVLTSFTVSDSILSPLMLQNWAGTLQPTKTYAEGQPIWFVAGYVQRGWADDDNNRNFVDGSLTLAGAGANLVGIGDLKTVFTSKDNCLNYSYSSAYMNFVKIDGLTVAGGSVQNNSAMTGNAEVSASAAKLEVTMIARSQLAPADATLLQVESAYPANAEDAGVTIGTKDSGSKNYYLQLMAFTNACNEAQGTAYAKCPIDYSEFTTTTDSGDMDSTLALYAAGTLIPGSWLNIYDANNNIKYTVVKGRFAALHANLANIGSAALDTVYMVYDADGVQIIGFVTTGKAYKGMVKIDPAVGATPGVFAPVQYTSDSGGKYAYSFTAGSAVMGEKAIDKADLQAVMDFFGFSFGNDYPILDKHIQAFAGWWQVLEAKYNVAAAVISNPDPGVDIVPKTGDASTAFGMIMVAIAGLAAVGFVMMKRVRG